MTIRSEHDALESLIANSELDWIRCERHAPKKEVREMWDKIALATLCTYGAFMLGAAIVAYWRFFNTKR